MREGNKDSKTLPFIQTGEKELSRIPLVSRLATFISVTSLELEEINKNLNMRMTSLRQQR